ncbi:protein of unknown function [Bradyrhizobium vignae]|uniref:Uncharacterized protein n=1 Tax=Bradyrhizobium vignae TaxID=1549949 RepID=A0A2U3QAB5_9BRAD|nr:protein of unknown function [Bradyrhizobium vignae]
MPKSHAPYYLTTSAVMRRPNIARAYQKGDVGCEQSGAGVAIVVGRTAMRVNLRSLIWQLASFKKRSSCPWAGTESPAKNSLRVVFAAGMPFAERSGNERGWMKAVTSFALYTNTGAQGL